MRRFVAVLVQSFLWALVWGVFGLVWVVATPFIDPGTDDINAVPQLAVWVAWGAISGAFFSILLIMAERSRSFASLSAGRFAMWGALGSIVLPFAVMSYVNTTFPRLFDAKGSAIALGISGGLGAIMGTLTLLLARREVAGDGRTA